MQKLTPRERLMVYLRLACAAVGLACGLAFCALRVYAQQAIIPVISAEDARQDEKIDDLRDFRHNQENYNAEQGKKLDDLAGRLSTVEGVGIGFSALVVALNGVMALIHLRKQKESE